jgi:PAS domain-containing protein
MQLNKTIAQLTNMMNYSNLDIFYVALNGRNKIAQVNKQVLIMLGYSNEAEFRKTTLSQLFETTTDFKKLVRELKEKSHIIDRIIRLRRKDSSFGNVRLHLFLTEVSGETSYCDGFMEGAETFISDNKATPYTDYLKAVFTINKKPVSDY